MLSSNADGKHLKEKKFEKWWAVHWPNSFLFCQKISFILLGESNKTWNAWVYIDYVATSEIINGNWNAFDDHTHDSFIEYIYSRKHMQLSASIQLFYFFFVFFCLFQPHAIGKKQIFLTFFDIKTRILK